MRKCLGQVECNLEELDYRRISLTIHAKALKEALQETDDRIARQRAAARTLDRDELFAVQGWAPRGQAAAVRKFCAERQLAWTIEPPGSRDNPPTLLCNPPPLRGGKGLV